MIYKLPDSFNASLTNDVSVLGTELLLKEEPHLEIPSSVYDKKKIKTLAKYTDFTSPSHWKSSIHTGDLTQISKSFCYPCHSSSLIMVKGYFRDRENAML